MLACSIAGSLAFFIHPIQDWIGRICNLPHLAFRLIRFILIPPASKEFAVLLATKLFVFAWAGFYIGGSAIFVQFSVWSARLVVRVLRIFSFVLRYCVSAFDPEDPDDLRIREKWAQFELRNGKYDGDFQEVKLAKLLEFTGLGISMGMSYFVKFIVDTLLVRTIMSILLSGGSSSNSDPLRLDLRRL